MLRMYDSLTTEGLITFFPDVASSIDIPVVTYDASHATGIDLTTRQRFQLGEIPGDVGEVRKPILPLSHDALRPLQSVLEDGGRVSAWIGL